MTARRGDRAAAFVLAVVAALPAVSFVASQPVQVDGPDPWPMAEHDALRTTNAGASPVPVDPSRFELAWSAAGGEQHSFFYPVAGELLAAPGSEVVVGVSSAIAVYDATGRGQGFIAMDPAGTGYPLLADLDGDGQNEIFVSHGHSLDAYEADGSLLWRYDWNRVTSSTISIPIAIDIDGDGDLDVVQTSRHLHFEVRVGGLSSGGALPDESPAVIALDGATGRVIFDHKLPCGEATTQTVGIDHQGHPTVVVGCLWRQGSEDGVPGSSVQAIRMDREAQLCGAVQQLCPVLDEALVVWTTEIQDGEATIVQVVGGDFTPAAGPEVVALWHRDGHLGMTTLSAHGKILFETVDKAFEYATFGPSVGDLDGDGFDDLVLAIPTHGMVAYHAAPLAFVKEWFVPDEPDLGHTGQSLSDLDGDGRPEIVSNWQGDLDAELSGAVRIHDADGTLLWETRLHTPPGDIPVMPIRSPCIGDLDMDGTHEICVAARGKFLVFKAPPLSGR